LELRSHLNSILNSAQAWKLDSFSGITGDWKSLWNGPVYVSECGAGLDFVHEELFGWLWFYWWISCEWQVALPSSSSSSSSEKRWAKRGQVILIKTYEAHEFKSIMMCTDQY